MCSGWCGLVIPAQEPGSCEQINANLIYSNTTALTMNNHIDFAFGTLLMPQRNQNIDTNFFERKIKRIPVFNIGCFPYEKNIKII